MSNRFIPIAAPTLGERELEYVTDCLKSTWISSRGEYLSRFETAFAEFCACPEAVACNNGTSALHLALLALGLGPGDEVIVPTLTYIASVNAITYCGATPRFVDVSPDTWNMDPEHVKHALGKATKAILAVHLYGEPADLGALQELGDSHGIPIVEDAAEAHGATFAGRPVGSIGAIGTFSFYGNKIVTTGEGGMVVTHDAELAERARLFRGQGQSPDRTYWFPVVGHNYRMTNIQAAIGLAQLEGLDTRLLRRAAIAARYRRNLGDLPGVAFQAGNDSARSANWMVGLVLPVSSEQERDRVAKDARRAGIETRPFFYPVHTMPPYAHLDPGPMPTADYLAARGLCLPTWTGLTDEDVDIVSDTIASALASPTHD